MSSDLCGVWGWCLGGVSSLDKGDDDAMLSIYLSLSLSLSQHGGVSLVDCRDSFREKR